MSWRLSRGPCRRASAICSCVSGTPPAAGRTLRTPRSRSGPRAGGSRRERARGAPGPRAFPGRRREPARARRAAAARNRRSPATISNLRPAARRRAAGRCRARESRPRAPPALPRGSPAGAGTAPVDEPRRSRPRGACSTWNILVLPGSRAESPRPRAGLRFILQRLPRRAQQLPRERQVRLRALRLDVVGEHGLAEGRRLGEPDVARNHGFEHPVSEMLADVVDDLSSEVSPLVEHRQDDAFEASSRVEGVAHPLDGIRGARSPPRGRSTPSASARAPSRPPRAR